MAYFQTQKDSLDFNPEIYINQQKRLKQLFVPKSNYVRQMYAPNVNASIATIQKWWLAAQWDVLYAS